VTFNYSNIAATALRLLTKFGRTASLRKITHGTYDPDTSTSTSTPTDYAGKGALFDFKERQLGTNFANASMIEVGDKRALWMPTTTTGEPHPGDRFVNGSDVWTILNLKTLNPGGTVVLYEFHVRK
jgi:hypothetical protein